MRDYLERAERAILNKLALLAEGGVAPMDKPNLHRSAPESSPPPGFGLGVEEVSLALFHQERFVKARESGKQHFRLRVIAEAERDYELATRKRPKYLSPDSDENARDKDESILRWGGKRPEWVAVFEGCSESHVRKLRKRNGRDPKTGLVPSGSDA